MKYLALGDSYTIGTCVEPHQSYPMVFKDLMKKQRSIEVAVDIIAKRGWTTKDLLDHLPYGNDYDLVTLLIGVNDLYDGVVFEDFVSGVNQLIVSALNFANNRADRVRVLSIPDYTFTPFAKAREINVSKDIDRYNQSIEKEGGSRGISYLDITSMTRRGLDEEGLIASDELHLSPKAYQYIGHQLYQSII